MTLREFSEKMKNKVMQARSENSLRVLHSQFCCMYDTELHAYTEATFDELVMANSVLKQCIETLKNRKSKI